MIFELIYFRHLSFIRFLSVMNFLVYKRKRFNFSQLILNDPIAICHLVKGQICIVHVKILTPYNLKILKSTKAHIERKPSALPSC